MHTAIRKQASWKTQTCCWGENLCSGSALPLKDLGTSLEDNGLLFIFNWRIIVYNIVLVSAMQQREPVGTHMLPPSWASLAPPIPSHPSTLSQNAGFELPASYSKFPMAVYFTCSNAYVSVLLSQFIPSSPSFTVSTSLFSTSAFPLLPCIQVPRYDFSRFHIYVLIYNICFSLSDLLHSVK